MTPRTATVHASPRELSLLIDGELPRQRAEQVEEHVDQCTACRERYLSTVELVEELRSLERVAPPSTLGIVVEQHRVEVGNRKLRQRLERSWRRWPDPMILAYLGVVLALGVMAVMVSRLEAPDAGTVIRAPSEAAPQIEAGESVGTWIEPGIGEAEAAAAVVADETQAAAVLERLDGAIPSEVRVVIARDGGEVVRVVVGE